MTGTLPIENPTRGHTHVSDQALGAIASRVAAEVAGVCAPNGKAKARPEAKAHVYGERATLRMRISVAYPQQVREATRLLREHLRDRAGELSGLDIRQVDIDVVRLAELPPAPRRVE